MVNTITNIMQIMNLQWLLFLNMQKRIDGDEEEEGEKDVGGAIEGAQIAAAYNICEQEERACKQRPVPCDTLQMLYLFNDIDPSN